jgi:H+/Cl- antiporter ClcA
MKRKRVAPLAGLSFLIEELARTKWKARAAKLMR